MNRINSISCFKFPTPNFSLLFRFRNSVADLCIPSLGIERPRPRKSTASPERVDVEHRAPWKLSHFGTPLTKGGTCGILHVKSSDQILLAELKHQNATRNPEFASHPEIYHLVDEFLRLFMSQDIA